MQTTLKLCETKRSHPLKASAAVESRDLVEPRLIFYVTGYMVTEAPSTVRARRLRERRSGGVVLIAPVEVGDGGGVSA